MSGLESSRTNAINISGKYHITLAKKFLNSHSNMTGERPVFECSNQDQQDVARNELVYYPLGSRANGSVRETIPHVLSSLNGAGETLTELFPKDPVTQTELMLESICVLGTAEQPSTYNRNNNTTNSSGHLFGVQVAGKADHIATQPMYVGGLLEYYIPLRDQNGRNSSAYNYASDRPDGKVTIELRHFEPQLAGAYIARRMRSVVFEQHKWDALIQRSNGGDLARIAPAWRTCAQAFKHMFQMAGILFLYRVCGHLAYDYVNFFKNRLIANGFDQAQIDDQFKDYAAQLNFKPDGNVLDKEKFGRMGTSYDLVTLPILSLSRRMGVVAEQSKLTLLPDSFLFESLEKREQSYIDELTRQFLGSVMFDGRHRELGFGLDVAKLPEDANRPYPRGVGGDLLTSTAFGNMLHQQLNSFNIFLSANVQAIRNRLGNIAGTVTNTGSVGQIFSYRKA